MTILRRLWQGDLPLEQAFWTWAVIGGIVINALTSIVFLALLMNGYTAAGFVAGYILSIPYNILVTVGVWRSAARHEGDRRWADLARIVTLAAMLVLSLT